MFNRFASSTNSGPFGSTTTANASPFGSFGSAAPSAAPPGTPSVPYSVTNEVENGITIKLLSANAMSAYRHLSPEELRVDDYSKGRKGPSAFPGSKPVGSSFASPFSSGPQQPANSAFPFSGSSTGSSFNAAPSTSSFNAAPSTGGLFGGPSPASTSSFGGFSGSSFAPQTNTASNAFSSTPFGGSFSNPSASQSSNSLFGQPQQQQQQTGFGTLTSPSPFGASSGSSLFGGPKPTTSSGSAFGSFGSAASNQPAVPSAFGQTGTFGAGGAPSATSTGLGLGFSNPQPQTSGLGAQSSLFQGSSSTGQSSLFPSTSSAAVTPTSTGSSGLFGGFNSTSQQQQPASTGFFGSATNSSLQSQSQAQSGGLFNTPSAAPLSSSLFGQPQSQQSTSFFGSNTAGTSLFRPATTTTTAAPSGSSFNFGASSTTPLPPAPSGGSLFGGGLSSNTPSSTTGGFATSSLFNRPTAQNISTPASTNTSSMFPSLGTSSSLFGQSQQQPSQLSQPLQSLQQQHQPLPNSNFPNVAAGSLSLAPPLPTIFAKTEPSANAKPSASTASTSMAPKSPVKFTPRTSFRIKPRESYNLSAPIPLNFGSDSGTTATLIPRKLAGITPNIKKLVIPDFNDSSFEVNTENNAANANTNINSYNNISNTSNIVNSETGTTGNILTSSMAFGQQYTFPPLKILKSLSSTELREVKNFVVGQKGIGEIRFLVSVDLSSIDLDAIFGHLVEFCEGEAVLYPDPSIPKPGPGEGLNLPAQVRLERIWTLSRASRDPIIDPQNEKVLLFTQKLRETEGTNFVSYDPANGTWIFTVDHF